MKNLVILIGNTGDNVKMHYFEGGGCIGRFPLATSRTYVNKQTNEKVTETEWHNIVVRNKSAEACEKYLKKGHRVYIEGMIKTRKWQDDKGQDRYSTEIVCNSFQFLTTKAESQGQTSQAQASGQQPAQGREQHAGDEFLNGGSDNDDLPF